jgi:hypothetical protein
MLASAVCFPVFSKLAALLQFPPARSAHDEICVLCTAQNALGVVMVLLWSQAAMVRSPLGSLFSMGSVHWVFLWVVASPGAQPTLFFQGRKGRVQSHAC